MSKQCLSFPRVRQLPLLEALMDQGVGAGAALQNNPLLCELITLCKTA